MQIVVKPDGVNGYQVEHPAVPPNTIVFWSHDNPDHIGWWWESSEDLPGGAYRTPAEAEDAAIRSHTEVNR